VVAIVAGSMACVLAGAAESANNNAERVDTARATLEKWVETRRMISRERQKWDRGRELLKDRIDLARGRIEGVREKWADAEKSIADAEKKRAALVEENDKLKAASGSLRETVTKLEARTRELLVRLPASLQERLKPLSQRIPDKPAETKLSLGERFQNVVGILNEVNKFNREMTVASEVRALADGTSAEVTVLYVGLGQAYYLGAKGKVAGIGKPSAKGWTWRPANEAAEQIAAAIAILKNERPASFVKMPVETK